MNDAENSLWTLVGVKYIFHLSPSLSRAAKFFNVSSILDLTQWVKQIKAWIMCYGT